MKRIIKIILFILIFLIGNFFFIKEVFYDKSKENEKYEGEINKEFIKVKQTDSIKGKILYIVSQELRAKNPLRTDLILYNHKKIWFMTKQIEDNKFVFFNEFIQNDDSLIKRSNSDTICIFRKDHIFKFLLDYK